MKENKHSENKTKTIHCNILFIFFIVTSNSEILQNNTTHSLHKTFVYKRHGKNNCSLTGKKCFLLNILVFYIYIHTELFFKKLFHLNIVVVI